MKLPFALLLLCGAAQACEDSTRTVIAAVHPDSVLLLVQRPLRVGGYWYRNVCTTFVAGRVETIHRRTIDPGDWCARVDTILGWYSDTSTYQFQISRSYWPRTCSYDTTWAKKIPLGEVWLTPNQVVNLRYLIGATPPDIIRGQTENK